MIRTSLESRLRQGRGTGEGASYDPWYRVHEVPSEGLSTRLLGWHTGRLHHLLSLLELRLFLLSEWRKDVLDIREQFPLDLSATYRICRDLSVTHRRGDAYTTDQLLTLRGTSTRFLAFAVKPSSKLTEERVLRTLEIERRYWAEVGVPWRIVTEREIPKFLCHNVAWVHNYYDLAAVQELGSEVVDAVRLHLLGHRSLASRPLSDLTSAFDRAHGLERGSALLAARHLIARRRLPVDMNARFIVPTRPLPLLGSAHRLAA